MPRYLIERTYTVDMETVPTVTPLEGDQALPLSGRGGHSHVVLDKDGTPKSFCIYSALSEWRLWDRFHVDRIRAFNRGRRMIPYAQPSTRSYADSSASSSSVVDRALRRS